MQRMWIEMEGLANLRDVGGIPTQGGGAVEPGRLLRSDNLQGLTPADVEALLALGLTDVVDLRSGYEAEQEGPGPLTRVPRVRIQNLSLFREWREGVGEDKPDEEMDARPEALPDHALPWVDLEPRVELANPVASVYLSYLVERPDSVLTALRTIATAEGATLVHCAAGKDRTGTIVALALLLVGAERDAVVADYVASSERMQAILDRLLASPTYNANLRDRPLASHLTHAETMDVLLDHLNEQYGGVVPLLAKLGWTEDDQITLERKLLG